MNAEPTGQDVLAVEIQAIEDQWTRLWKETTAATPANGGHPATRNSVLNLVVFTQRAATAQAVDSALDELSQHHPARSVVLVAQPDQAQEEMKAWIDLSVYKQELRQGQNVSERVKIEAKGRAVDYLPGVVLPLLAANLPVFTWWADVPPLDQKVFERLSEVSDRMIVDSAEFASVGQYFLRLGQLSRSRQFNAAVSDLNWQRLAPWRELVAQFYDMKPAQPYLSAISQIVIEYAGSEANGRTVGVANPAQGMLLIGWLASKLNWIIVPGQQKQNGGVYHLALRSDLGAQIAVEIRPRVPEARKKPPLITSLREAQEDEHEAGPTWMASQMVAGALSTVTITSVHGGHTGVFVIRRSADHEHATTSCTIDGTPWGQARTVHLDSIGRSELMLAELEAFGHDEGFEDALSIAGGLAS
ncbi:MAG TPA: glucose-6-phosphate dehydrogenase assembly protein OpcA [Ktedonobacterales bacterium]|nr:glucose-6-phosphate dehydrogenase assembly protein OpcA [Ktedonobacterales bacterium]